MNDPCNAMGWIGVREEKNEVADLRGFGSLDARTL